MVEQTNTGWLKVLEEQGLHQMVHILVRDERNMGNMDGKAKMFIEEFPLTQMNRNSHDD
jgi:hypothetical protein